MADTLSTDPAVREILARLERREGVRRGLDGGGLISVDRGLPFLLVHRRRRGDDDAGTARLVSGEASYLLSGADPEEDVGALVSRVAEAGSTGFGAFLVWRIFNPEMVVIGGGVAVLGDHLLAPARLAMLAHSFLANRDDVRLTMSSLEDDTGLFGAAALALSNGGGRPPIQPD